MITSAKDYFPFNDFRENQKEVIEKAQEYFENGTDVVIIEGPTGFGKSPVNIALGRYFKPSFYTTPQSKLVEQLAVDFGPKDLIIDGGISEYDAVPLLARSKYICKKSHQPSDQCKYYRNNENHKCSTDPDCTYWIQKQGVFDAGIAITTFSNLIVNKYIPVFIQSDGNTRQISYNKRNLLIIDECHSLEEQIASLHAGFVISPNTFPGTERTKMAHWRHISSTLPKKSFFTDDDLGDHMPFLEKTLEYAKIELDKEKGKYASDKKIQEKFIKIINSIKYLFSELNENRKWIINTKKSEYFNVDYPEFKPIRVDRFLQEFIWSYADKYLLTSATIHYRKNIHKWLDRIGLGDKSFKFISLSMSFPVKNRPIYLNLQGALTSKHIQKNWSNCIKTIKEIIRKHPNQKGVIHCSSFKMMWDLFNDLRSEFSIFVHNKKEIKNNDVIKEWIRSKKNIIISPSIYEGVDLKDDLCRFQILFKVPYAHIGDQRVSFLLNDKRDWTWYNNEAALKIIQAYGRAVRHPKDHADFYIIDGSFSRLFQKVEFPEWFTEAIQ